MVPGRLRPQETGEALLDRLRGGKADGSAPSAPAVRELRPAEAAKDEGNKAFARGDWLAAAAQYSRWVGGAGSGGASALCALWHGAGGGWDPPGD